jgi:NADP-dependent 3-hydroxy acid dehydrogenase YdfG
VTGPQNDRCSRGFGRLWAEAALKRGDRVVATACDDSRLKPLAEAFPDTALILPLDVTRRGAVFDAVAAAVRPADAGLHLPNPKRNVRPTTAAMITVTARDMSCEIPDREPETGPRTPACNGTD